MYVILKLNNILIRIKLSMSLSQSLLLYYSKKKARSIQKSELVSSLIKEIGCPNYGQIRSTQSLENNYSQEILNIVSNASNITSCGPRTFNEIVIQPTSVRLKAICGYIHCMVHWFLFVVVYLYQFTVDCL